MKVCKFMLTTVSHAKFQVVVDACHADPQAPAITQAEHNHALILQQALHYIPNPNTEMTTKNVAMRLGQQLLDQVQTHYFKVCKLWFKVTFSNISAI